MNNSPLNAAVAIVLPVHQYGKSEISLVIPNYVQNATMFSDNLLVIVTSSVPDLMIEQEWYCSIPIHLPIIMYCVLQPAII